MNLVTALRLIGLGPEWVGAFVSHPQEFRDLLTNHLRTVTRNLHPDTKGHIALSERFPRITVAVDELKKADDEKLTAAMREFADRYALPAKDLLTVAGSLKTKNEELEGKVTALEARVGELERTARNAVGTDVRLMLALLRAPLRRLTNYEGHGRPIGISDLYDRMFYTPIKRRPFEQQVGGVTTAYQIMSTRLCYVDPSGNLYSTDVDTTVKKKSPNDWPTTDRLIAKVRKIAPQFKTNYLVGVTHSLGSVVGFTTTSIAVTANRELLPIPGDDGSDFELTTGSSSLLELCSQHTEIESVYFPLERVPGGILSREFELAVVAVDDRVTEEGIPYAIVYIEEFLDEDMEKPSSEEEFDVA